jgi:hypothetical protein
MQDTEHKHLCPKCKREWLCISARYFKLGYISEIKCGFTDKDICDKCANDNVDKALKAIS